MNPPTAVLNALAPALQPRVWRAHQLGAAAARGVPTGHAALDAQLADGGWPRHGMTEILADAFGVGELQLVLPALVRISTAGRHLMWIAPPALPYAPALAAAGVAVDRVLLLQPTSERDRWWAIDQALKSGSLGAVLAWLPEERRAAGSDQLRRLQLAASGADSLCFVFRRTNARTQASPAPLRLALAPLAGGRLSVTVVKRRGPPLASPLVLDLPDRPRSTVRAVPQLATADGAAVMQSLMQAAPVAANDAA